MHYLVMAFRVPVTPVQRGKDVLRPELSSPSVLFYNLLFFLDRPVCSKKTKYKIQSCAVIYKLHNKRRQQKAVFDSSPAGNLTDYICITVRLE